jgi:hypothetical protein
VIPTLIHPPVDNVSGLASMPLRPDALSHGRAQADAAGVGLAEWQWRVRDGGCERADGAAVVALAAGAYTRSLLSSTLALFMG